MVQMAEWAHAQFQSKYAHDRAGRKETWEEACDRVVDNVVVPYLPQIAGKVRALMYDRKFVPGGRYLYAAGRKFQQLNNCFLFRAEDSREGWGRLFDKCANSLMTGGGVGVVYSQLRPEMAIIDRMGGTSTGPLAPIKIINELGRYTRQGGSRRSAIWAGLHWNHPDVFKFVHMKDWDEVTLLGKRRDFNFPAPGDSTNVSVILDDDFFEAYHSASWSKTYKWGNSWYSADGDRARDVYWAVVRNMLRNGEPGFSVDVGENSGENLRNAPVHGDTRVLVANGSGCGGHYRRAADLVGERVTVWTGKQWAAGVSFKKTAENAPTVRVRMTGGREIVCEPSHPFLVEVYEGRGARRRLASVERVPATELEEGDVISCQLPEPEVGAPEDLNNAYTLGFVQGDGSFVSRRCAEVTIASGSKKVCASRFTVDHTASKDSRGYDRYYFHSHPLWDGQEKLRVPVEDGSAFAAAWLAGLFDADGNVLPSQHRVRLSSVSKDFLNDVARLLETLGVLSHVTTGGSSGYGGQDSWQLVVAADYVQRFMEVIPTLRVRFDTSGYHPHRRSTIKVLSVTPDEPADVYCADVGVEEHCFCAEGVLVSNCTEVTSKYDSDCCNLASLVVSRFATAEEFSEAVDLGTAFLLCGTLASALPVADMHKVREQTRRIGLGLMGLHEWLLRRDRRYGPDDELAAYMEAYKRSGAFAARWADKLGINRPVATRSVAPTGTISIVAETTSGCEPVFAAAYRRRYRDGNTVRAMYVVDPVAMRLVETGTDPKLIEDSLSLSEDVERRIGFQAWLQQYVDHGISSTINLPAWGSSLNNEDGVTRFGNTLLKYLPRLRGITAYPDGARDGQPLVRVPFEEALANRGKVLLDAGEGGCKDGVCSS